jgi:DnaJ-class molecular chaperone
MSHNTSQSTRCPTCEGTGRNPAWLDTLDATQTRTTDVCPTCDGCGWVWQIIVEP